MADEEQQWLNAQQASPATGSEFGLRDQEEGRMDAVVNEKMVVDETAVVDETMDEATTLDPDDDIISGCYMHRRTLFKSVDSSRIYPCFQCY